MNAAVSTSAVSGTMSVVHGQPIINLCPLKSHVLPRSAHVHWPLVDAPRSRFRATRNGPRNAVHATDLLPSLPPGGP